LKFEKVLSPSTIENFLKSTWGSDSIIFTGKSNKFSCLPKSSDIPKLVAGTLENSNWTNTHNLTAQAYKTGRNGVKEHFQDVPISMYTQLFNAGYGLCFDDISFAVPELQELVKDIMEMEFSGAGAFVTCYLTPPYSHGVLHFDHQHVFFLQVEGKKEWRISESQGIVNPVSNFIYSEVDQSYLDDLKAKGYEVKLPQECGFQDIVLEEGDVLYLPPGYYHLGHTEDSHSLHYTLTLEPLSVFSKIFGAFHQEFLKHSSRLNIDTRFMNEGDKDLVLEENVRLIKKVIGDISVEDLISVIGLDKNRH